MTNRIGRTDQPKLTQWAFTAPFEGIVPHLYVDTRGHITCGVGFLVPNIQALDAYPFTPSIATARADFAELLTAPAGKLPAFYRRITCARLREADMRHIFAEKMSAFYRQISQHWELPKQPEPVQMALLDMSYTLGAAGLRKYAKLHRAVMARDWPTAAQECKRGGVQRARDLATMALFTSCLTHGSDP